MMPQDLDHLKSDEKRKTFKSYRKKPYAIISIGWENAEFLYFG
jgi:hypothetical protein